MTTAANDFDLAKAVADQLKEIEKERQQRILRWVSESLGLEVSAPPVADLRHPQTMAPTESTASQHLDTHSTFRCTWTRLRKKPQSISTTSRLRLPRLKPSSRPRAKS